MDTASIPFFALVAFTARQASAPDCFWTRTTRSIKFSSTVVSCGMAAMEGWGE
jgi:hypothetical protein